MIIVRSRSSSLYAVLASSSAWLPFIGLLAVFLPRGREERTAA